MPDEILMLSTIHKDLFAFGSFAIDVTYKILAGWPYGGTAILRRNSLASAVNLVNSNCTQITLCEVNVNMD